MRAGENEHTVGTFLLAWVLLLLSVPMGLIGCGVCPSNGAPSVKGGGPINAGQAPAGTSPNDDSVALTVTSDGPFETYKSVPVANGALATVEGHLARQDSFEVIDIGPLAVGDRLLITTEARDGLDPVLAVFDADGDALMVNDDRNDYAGDLDATVDFRSPRQSPRCYVAVAASYSSDTAGGYVLNLRRWAGDAAPQPRPQLVYLNFDGHDAVVIGRREPVEVPPFEGTLLGIEFADLTELLIEQTVAQIQHDYIGLNVEFISSREGPAPGEPHTTVHFGASDPGLLGIADYVDEFNRSVSQQAIIFADSFRAFLPLRPSVEEMASALANVASHETAHLLGLNHTADPLGIMDITANLRQMLASQAFRRSPLHREVFPVGHQDPALLLMEAVGGDATLFKAAAVEQLTHRPAWYDQGEPTPARSDRPFSLCGCAACAKNHHRHVAQMNADE